MPLFDVLVFNEKTGDYATFAIDKSKRDAKMLVKSLRQKGRKAQFVSAKETNEVPEENLFLENDEQGRADDEQENPYREKTPRFSRQSPYKTMGLLEKD